jgi:hypothetical protein
MFIELQWLTRSQAGRWRKASVSSCRCSTCRTGSFVRSWFLSLRLSRGGCSCLVVRANAGRHQAYRRCRSCAASQIARERTLNFVVIAILLLIIGVLTFNDSPPEKWRLEPVGPAKSIAVLPFADLSRDPENAHFADGVTDPLTADLAQIHFGACGLVSLDAQSHYFRGRFHFDQGTEAGLRAAITEYSGLVAETDTSSNR